MVTCTYICKCILLGFELENMKQTVCTLKKSPQPTKKKSKPKSSQI